MVYFCFRRATIGHRVTRGLLVRGKSYNRMQIEFDLTRHGHTSVRIIFGVLRLDEFRKVG